jgi:hypothetical protein
VVEGGAHVADRGLGVEAGHVLHRRGQARLVVGEGQPRGDAPEQIRGHGDVAEPGQPPAGRRDVVVDPEDLVDHHDAGTAPGLREGDVGGERAAAVGGCDLLRALLHGADANPGAELRSDR